MSSNESDLLASLEAQGDEFMKSFDIMGRQKRANDDVEFLRNVKPRVVVEDEEDEWTGFGSCYEDDTDTDLLQTTGRKCVSESHTPQVVVFSEGTSKPLATRSQSRAFMSSKVSKLKESPTDASDQKSYDNEDSDQEISAISNLQNDALLHRLVHTKLLSGSLNPELNMTPAQRRKALAGRVLELAGDSKLGKGEIVVRQDEKKRASKRVREGMMAKQREREARSLDEAKNAGNYHPALKKLFAASASESQPRKRDRGLKMGVGRFSGGTLKLMPEEIGSVRDAQSSRGRGRGRGGRGFRKGKKHVG